MTKEPITGRKSLSIQSLFKYASKVDDKLLGLRALPGFPPQLAFHIGTISDDVYQNIESVIMATVNLQINTIHLGEYFKIPVMDDGGMNCPHAQVLFSLPDGRLGHFSQYCTYDPTGDTSFTSRVCIFGDENISLPIFYFDPEKISASDFGLLPFYYPRGGRDCEPTNFFTNTFSSSRILSAPGKYRSCRLYASFPHNCYYWYQDK